MNNCFYAEYDADGCYCKKLNKLVRCTSPVCDYYKHAPITNKDVLKTMDFLPVLVGIEEKYNICPLVLFDARDRYELWPRCAKFGACEKCLKSWLTEEKYNAEK